eukprot:GEMP01066652.1.p1 GENE.GEMP01066652.1~~GEMP01066652.1.p1  ORF type:complete len:309 (+),score=72.10 GEMP01066652.1:47-973(+)
MQLDLKGIFPPIPTPFTADEELDFAAMKENMDAWNTYDLRGIVVQGSNGEYVSFSSEERVQMVKESKRLLKPGRLLIAGSGCEGTGETIRMSRAMVAAGADALLVITPSYFKSRMTEEALENHFREVAKAISPSPIIVYNMPANTGIDMSAKLIIKLAQIDNVIALKDSGGNVQKLAIIKDCAPADFQIIAGSAGFLLPALSIGAVGGICAFANCCPQECISLAKAFFAGDMKTARELQTRIAGPNLAVTGTLGVAGMKKAMDLLGWKGGKCRLPLLPLSEKEEEDLKSIFANADLLPSKKRTRADTP